MFDYPAGPLSNHRCPESKAEGDLTHTEGHVATGPKMSTATRGMDLQPPEGAWPFLHHDFSPVIAIVEF